MHPHDAVRHEPTRPGPARPVWMLRFTRAERAIHHVTALLMGVCLVTAGMLYLPMLSTVVGHRELVKTVHVWCGFALPAPIVLGLVSRAFRTDLRSLNRFAPHDWEWLKRGDRRAVRHGRGVLPVGKFNAGQKLNAAFTAGAILLMLGTGEMLTFPDPWPVHWRTGATFVHDWLFLIIVIVVAGHLWEAFRDKNALGGMLTGRVDRDWAARHHPGWLDAVQRGAARAPDGGSGTASGEEVSGATGEGGPEFAKRRPGMS
ncbi:cytochrome b/b6 domain-containing protein [Actinomadura napierensis]|uniref:Formate dehydrogenase subunit gamma n=1 Tax=Actinomadura napierensis TaxID=267854 RepID=A0ABN2YI36_9ACTN